MHALRIHEPEHAATRWSSCDLPDDARCTLREYYTTNMEAERKLKRSKRTTGGDREALVKWDLFGDAHPADWRTDFGRFRLVPKPDTEPILNPPIGVVCDSDLARWQRRCQDYGLANTTINKHQRALKVMWRSAGPRDGRNPYGRGILMAVPCVPVLPESKKRPVIPTVDQIDELMIQAERQAARSEWWPLETWRALIVFTTCFGLRPGDLGRVTLRNFDLSNRADMRLKFQPSKTAGKYLEPFDFPLRPEVWQYCEAAIKATGNKHGILFPGLMSSRAYRLPEWRELVELAGCSRRESDSAKRSIEKFDLYAVRRFANVWVNSQFEGFPGEWLLGHKFKDRDKTNLEHYSDFLTPPDSVQNAMMTAQLPESFRRFLP